LNLVVALRRDESGQDLAEYALLVALIALVVVVAVSLTGQTISEFFVDAAQQIGGGEGKGTCCD
jgi:Flp pilus assembly pilin Flp